MSARWPLLLGLLGSLVPAAPARADAGAVVLREERGAVAVTLLAAPVPLEAGRVELEVLVQARGTGAPVLDADAVLRLDGPGGERTQAVAQPGIGGNRLLRGARVALASAGTWRVELRVVGAAGVDETFHARVEVAPPRGPARRYWAFIAAGPAGLALLALHQALGLAMRGARRTSRPRDPR